ncbi:unnamed protein product [Ectocarpus sp. 12 AP-2014]
MGTLHRLALIVSYRGHGDAGGLPARFRGRLASRSSDYWRPSDVPEHYYRLATFANFTSRKGRVLLNRWWRRGEGKPCKRPFGYFPYGRHP